MLTWDNRKGVDETLDYYFDAGPWIEPAWEGDSDAPETLTSLAAVVTSGTVVITSQSKIGAMLQMIISGGAVGEVDLIEVTLITSKGRTYTETCKLRIGG